MARGAREWAFCSRDVRAVLAWLTRSITIAARVDVGRAQPERPVEQAWRLGHTERQNREETMPGKGFCALALCALLSLGAARAEQGVTATTIEIGAFGPITGPAAYIGLGGRDGANLAIKEINA